MGPRFSTGSLFFWKGQSCRTLFGLWLLSCMACQPVEEPCELQAVDYQPTPYTVVSPEGLPPLEIPADNPMTAEGIRLGRHLFYDPILSADSTVSCGSCHRIEKAFTDGQATSVGVNGLMGKRSSMSLINVGYTPASQRGHRFMWDGRFETLEEQAVQPIIDPFEMNHSWAQVEQSLRQHPTYPAMFRQAFGIACAEELTIEHVGKALAQFERTLNSADSEFDRFLYRSGSLSSAAMRGLDLFLGDERGNFGGKDAECAHCHNFSPNSTLFAGNNFSDNGLDAVAHYSDFDDAGLGGVTGDHPHYGRFREVTLRNIALTAPYMHDGRLATLEEVLDHYVHGLQRTTRLAGELANAQTLHTLQPYEVDDILAFLHTLTDTSYVQGRPEWRSPFE